MTVGRRVAYGALTFITILTGTFVGIIPGATRAKASTFTEYSIPSANSVPQVIASGPDGNMWFSQKSLSQIGRISQSGSINEFSVPAPTMQTAGITSGPDGALWATDVCGNCGATGGQIDRISTSGNVTEYPIPVLGSSSEIRSSSTGVPTVEVFDPSSATVEKIRFYS